MICSWPIISLPPYESQLAYLLDMASKAPDNDMEAGVDVKKEDEKLPIQDSELQQDLDRLRSISPVNQSLPFSHPVTRLPLRRRCPFSGAVAQGAAAYNRAERNIFLRMQRADPLSASNSGYGNATQSPERAEEQLPQRKVEESSMVPQRNDALEEEVAAQLSSIVYSNVKDTEGKGNA